MKTITRRQQQILDFIEFYVTEQGMPPTRRNITDQFQFRSPNAADEHLRALARKGYINLIPRTSRGIELNFTSSAYLPIIGRVAAGSPILAEEHVENKSNINKTVFSPQADYLLRVQGESMINAGINDGDLLAVHKTIEVQNNQIVVARLDGEVTVKRFGRHPSNLTVLLQPENDDYPVIEVDEGTADLHIEGIGVGLIRTSM